LQHHQQATINHDWFIEKIRAAASIRAPLLQTDTDGYRLIHGENDGLPGLVVDRYADTLVMKLYSAAWIPHLADVIPALEEVQPHQRLVIRASRSIDLPPMGDAPSEPIIFQENGLRFAADVVHGHKTGFFFDQRDNRARVRALADGRRVLDVFAYSGGFSVYAAAGGASHVTSLDVSAPALDAAVQNMKLNKLRVDHRTLVMDAFAGMESLHQQKERFDMVVVDPPSFANKSADVRRALASYDRLARLAVSLLAPAGILVMASCSSHVSADDFFRTVTRAAHLEEIERTGHALDHPIGFPEGAYLKCLYATTSMV
jgi:23S rRNA (cytosine1962-C5)-methyltransferase